MKKGVCLFIICAIIIATPDVLAQIGVFTEQPDQSAEIDIHADDKGVLIPRIELGADLANPNPVAAPAQGLMVFNTGMLQEQGFYTWTGTEWKRLQTPTADTVHGPDSSTDEAVARFDGASGKLIQNSGVLLDDLGNLTGISQITAGGFAMTTNPFAGRLLTSDAAGEAHWGIATPFNIKKDDVLIASNVSQLNFNGGSTVRDEGNNKATVSFYTNTVTRDLIQLASMDSLSLNSLTDPVPIPWDTELNKNASTFIHSSLLTPSRIQVRRSGIYEVNYIVNTISKTIQRKTLRIRLRVNGSDYVPYAVSYSFSYNMADFESAHNSSSFLIELSANDYVELVANGQTHDGPLLLIPERNVFFMRLIREY